MTFSAIIFDMDGLLVDSEPLWYDVEVEIIESKGYTYTDEVHDSTVGLRVDEFSKIIFKHYPNVADSPQAVGQAVMDGMTSLPKEKIKPRPGAEDVIRYVAEQKIPCAIASSSSQVIIEHFVKILGWGDLIPQRYSAEFMKLGKPAPDIYLHTAQQLGLDPAQCLALEDSRAGTQAALAAGMTCYTVPDLSHSKMTDFDGINDNIYASLVDVLDEFKTKRLFS
jgi:mannitol-1-/sugar-/sorbitol-6-/2-deoxyglucose-6-phosphatase